MTTKVTYNIVYAIESYLNHYMAFSRAYGFPLALWAIATHMFESFDAFPYLAITASTKQAGKTRCAELLSFAVNNPFFTSGATAPAVFTKFDISEKEKKAGVTAPTVFFDEAEEMGKADGGSMSMFLNSGYRRGQVVPRVNKSYPSYSPKAFICIGDVRDTLRDRSLLVILQRGEPKGRFLWTPVQEQGNELRETILGILAGEQEKITACYPSYLGLDFMPDRDAEIWAPLFAVCDRLAPARMDDLKRMAADMTADKTAPIRRHVNLVAEENAALDDQYAKRLLIDLHAVLGTRKALSTIDALDLLMDLPTAPWRRFRGIGLTPHDMGNMLSRFHGVKPRPVQIGKGREGRKIVKGYKLADLDKAVKGLSQ